MFDAKKLLDQLIGGGAQQHAQQQSGGGLSDILGQFTGGKGGQQDAGGGGLGDILGQLQKQLGGGQGGGAAGGRGGGDLGGLSDILGKLGGGQGGSQGGGQARNISEERGGRDSGQGSGDQGGGLADILGQLQKQLGGGQGGGAAGGQGGGGIADILGNILGQATAGVKEGAGRISDATGAGEALNKATGGRSADDLMNQLMDLIANNKMAAGAAAGGLGAVVLGTQTGRGLAMDAAKLGGLVLIGGLAYKAMQNYQKGKPLLDTASTGTEAAPSGSGFETAAVTNDSAILYIRTMIASAAADGRIDEREQERIFGSMKQAGYEREARDFLEHEMRNPASIDQLAAAVKTPEVAVQVFTAARLAIDFDNESEQQFLMGLAQKLQLDPELAQHIDAAARGTPA